MGVVIQNHRVRILPGILREFVDYGLHVSYLFLRLFRSGFFQPPEELHFLSYSMVRMSVNPVTSKISMMVSPTWVTVMPPFWPIFFCAASSTRSPAEEM